MTDHRMLFLNLPVADLAASKTFFEKLGFAFDPRFASEECACLVLNEQAYVMLLTRERFGSFTPTPVADAHTVTEALICVSADTRAGVDALADAAIAAGGEDAREPEDHGFMYGRSFRDLDGHIWEVAWMDPKAAAEGPAAMSQAA